MTSFENAIDGGLLLMFRRASLVFLLTALGTTANAAAPVYFHWDEVTLVEGQHTIRAKMAKSASTLEFLTIETSENLIEVDPKELRSIKGPLLDTISFSLMPFEIEGEYQYLYQLSFKYAPSGDQTCSEENNGETETWAPVRVFYVIFEGSQYTTNSATLDCDE